MPTAPKANNLNATYAKQFIAGLSEGCDTGESGEGSLDEEDVEKSSNGWETEESVDTRSEIGELCEESPEESEDERSVEDTSEEEEVGGVPEEDQICWRCRILGEEVQPSPPTSFWDLD